MSASLKCERTNSAGRKNRKKWWKQSILGWSRGWAPGCFGNLHNMKKMKKKKKKETVQWVLSALHIHHGFSLMLSVSPILATAFILMEDVARAWGMQSFHQPCRMAGRIPLGSSTSKPHCSSIGKCYPSSPGWNQGRHRQALCSSSGASAPDPSSAQALAGDGPRRSPAPRTGP